MPLVTILMHLINFQKGKNSFQNTWVESYLNDHSLQVTEISNEQK